jgi:hypothetical protein
MARASVIVLAAVAVALHALGAPSPDPGVRALAWIARADVKADFRTHVTERGDTRFIGVHNAGAVIPALPPDMQVRVFQQKRVRFIRGTSDAITSPEYGRLVTKAHKYARCYNLMLLQYLRRQREA